MMQEHEECGHKPHEEHMICILCGRCREDLDEYDTCSECLGTVHASPEHKSQRDVHGY